MYIMNNLEHLGFAPAKKKMLLFMHKHIDLP